MDSTVRVCVCGGEAWLCLALCVMLEAAWMVDSPLSNQDSRLGSRCSSGSCWDTVCLSCGQKVQSFSQELGGEAGQPVTVTRPRGTGCRVWAGQGQPDLQLCLVPIWRQQLAINLGSHQLCILDRFLCSGDSKELDCHIADILGFPRRWRRAAAA